MAAMATMAVVDRAQRIVGGPRNVSDQFRRMLVAYGGDAALNASEAARLAGYRNPSKVGPQMLRRYPEAFAAVEATFKEQLKASADEVLERLAALARTPNHKDHYKSLELLAKIHGLLSDNGVVINIDRRDMAGELREAMRSLARGWDLLPEASDTIEAAKRVTR
jgi:hypothetical protein